MQAELIQSVGAQLAALEAQAYNRLDHDPEHAEQEDRLQNDTDPGLLRRHTIVLGLEGILAQICEQDSSVTLEESVAQQASLPRVC